MLIKEQSSNVYKLILGIVFGTSIMITPSHATSSVSIEHKSDANLDIAVTASKRGTLAIATEDLSISTSNAAGYSLYISTGEETNYLYSEDGDYIPPTSSTVQSPAALDLNSWGFAASSHNAGTVVDSISVDYDTLQTYNNRSSSGRWAAVPKKSDMTLIQRTGQKGTFDLDVHYGFNIGYETPAGTYSVSILYTAIVNPIESYDIGPFSVSPGRTDKLTDGHSVKLTAPVSPETDLDDIGTASVFIGEEACLGASGAISNGMLIIICSAKALPAGTYDITINLNDLDGSNHYIQGGYVVGLSFASQDLVLSPSKILTNTSGELSISTQISTQGLNVEDMEVKIGDALCPLSELFYDDQGFLNLTASYPALEEAGDYTVRLYSKSYREEFSGTITVSNDATLTGITYMQEMTPAVCEATVTPDPTARETVDSFYSESDKVPTNRLIDLRDGKAYTVSKLSDGNCWMTQNLRLGGTEPITLTNETTDLSESFTLPAAQTEGNIGWNNAIAHVYDTRNEVSGSLYNWYTATAGTGMDGELAEDVTSSVCPKGWTLPSMTGETSYTALLSAYGWTNRSQVVDTLVAPPFSFVFSGGYYYGYGGTANGEYWTSSPMSTKNENALYLKVESTSRRVYTEVNKPRSGGAAVRCVARKN